MIDVRVAVIGLGWVGLNRHLPALMSTPGARLVGVVDRDGVRASQVASRHRLTKSSSAVEPGSIAWLDEIDAVVLATSPETHERMAIGFLEAGKHVLVEKPMALSSHGARAMVEAATKAQRMLAVVHNFQFSKSVRRAECLLTSGRLGELRAVWGAQMSSPDRRLPVWYEELPLGLFTDESPHFFYLLRQFLGVAAEVDQSLIVKSTSGRRTPSLVTITVKNGTAPGKIDMFFDASISEWHLAVCGSSATAFVDIFRDIVVLIPADGRHGATDIMRSTMRGVGGHLAGVLLSGTRMVTRRLNYGNDEVYRRFVHACATGAAPEGMSGADGAAVVAMQEAVRIAAETQGMT